MRWCVRFVAAVFTVAAFATGGAMAQVDGGDDLPPLIAGRLAFAEGDSQVWRVDEDQRGAWDSAQLNDVISVATGLHTGVDGRLEFRIGPHSFRLGQQSRGGFSRLDYDSKIFNLEHGTLGVTLAPAAQGEQLAVTLPGLQVDLQAPGRYRIDSGTNGASRITTFDGQAIVRGGNGTVTVGAGQALTASANLVAASYEQAASSAFDQWALARDQQSRASVATRYVSPYMTGYEELDAHGDWISDSTYGVLWTPRAVPVGWAPYRHGQWRWVSPWGWTWVDHAPWGYAPFHYGRWVVVGSRWHWWPGGYVARPVWAPALVGFVGGSGVNVSINIGGPVVGWYPLAPWHRYHPHFRSGPRYVTIINQTIINTPPRGVHRDVNRERGGTMVPGPRFREPVHRVALHDRNKFAQLQPITAPPRSVGGREGRPDERREWRGEDRRADRGQDRGQWRGDDRRSQQGEDRRSERGEDRRQGRGDDDRWQRGEDRRGARQPGTERTAPVGDGQRPTRIAPPLTADPVPGRGVTPPPALPGNAPQLAPPPEMRTLPAPAPRAEPPQIRPSPEMRRLPRPHLPEDQQPPGPRPRFTDPAEPARTPPGAPPTVRQPTRSAPTDGSNQWRGTRPVAPNVVAAPAPVAVPGPAAPTLVAPTQPVVTPPRVAPPRAERQADAPRPSSEAAVREARDGGRFRGGREGRQTN